MPISPNILLPGKTAGWERAHFFDRLIWLFPLVYCFHIMEESNGFANWVTHVLRGTMAMQSFFINNAVFMVILLTLCYLAAKTKNTVTLFLLFFWTGAQEFWNFIFHIYSQFRFNAYSPGYFTAILLYLPVWCYLSYICLREGFLQWPAWICAWMFSISGMAFVIWGGLYHFTAVPWHLWI